MVTITLDQGSDFKKTHFKDIDELFAYLMKESGGILHESNSELNAELDRRLKEMDDNPESVISVQQAITFAKTGK